MDRRLLSISEVTKATGLQSSALRYYERRGLIRPEGRASGRRYYDEAVLRRLAAIRLLQEVGFTIGEISEIVGRSDYSSDWRSVAESKLTAIDAQLERVAAARDLLTAALACECSSLDSCELLSARRGPHRDAVETLSLGFRPRA